MQPTLSPKQFALAGNSTFTVVSKKTEARFTFKVRQPKNKPHFVSVLTGPQNETDYTFLGTIFNETNFVHSRNSKITKSADSAKAFNWLWNKLSLEDKAPESCEIHHEGRCCRCGRTLTVPSSILSGIGPECAGKI
jgi:hypothetical protein